MYKTMQGTITMDINDYNTLFEQATVSQRLFTFEDGKIKPTFSLTIYLTSMVQQKYGPQAYVDEYDVKYHTFTISGKEEEKECK